MIWGETWREYGLRIKSDHLWFAWHPVRLRDGRWVWLEHICRAWGGDGLHWTGPGGWNYRPKESCNQK